MKLNIELPYSSAVPFLGYLSKRNENLSSRKNLYVNVYSSFIHNHDSSKIGNNPNILQLVNGQTVVHPYNRKHLSNKKLWSMDTRKNMYESQMYWAKLNKTDSKGYIVLWLHLYDIL